jgi:hypothetical protein
MSIRNLYNFKFRKYENKKYFTLTSLSDTYNNRIDKGKYNG